MFNSSYFDNIDTEEKAYWFGFIVADGGLHRNGKQVRVLLGAKGRGLLLRLAAMFRVQVRDASYTDKRTGRTIVQINSVRLWTAIVDEGLPHRKRDMASAIVVQHIPIELRRHFVRGYFDGDGCISKIGRSELGAKEALDRHVVGFDSAGAVGQGRLRSHPKIQFRYLSRG